MGVMNETKDKMKKAIEHFELELRNLRSNRVNPHMFDDLKATVYGSEMTIKSVATATVQERQVVLTPFDPTSAPDIAKAIQTSPLGLNPVVEGNLIRVPVPPLNEDLRKEIAKQAKQKAESAKVTIREIRRKGNESVRKQKADGEIAEDEMKGLEKKVQELTDEHCKIIDQACAMKEKEILTI